MVRFTYMLLLLAGFSAISAAQTPPAAPPRPNALELLRQISKKYEQARYYHIETVQESETHSDMSRSWTKSITTAILAPGNRYRFASKAEFGEILKVSNGKIETNYNAATKEYMQQPTPEHGPQSSRAIHGYGAIRVVQRHGCTKNPIKKHEQHSLGGVYAG
jgi:outer membrane lipoprotein-sorting protein